jgi:hypothetical protein
MVVCLVMRVSYEELAEAGEIPRWALVLGSLTLMEDSDAAARRMRAAIEMYEVGVAMYTMRMRREHPDASDAEIDAMVNRWSLDRPGARDGDAAGVSASYRFR